MLGVADTSSALDRDVCDEYINIEAVRSGALRVLCD